MIKQVEILKDLIAGIERVVQVTAIVDNGDDTYELSNPFTFYLTISKKVTIDGLIYIIKDFELNVSLTVAGVGHTTVPTATSFPIDAPLFRHGSPKLVNTEHTAEKIPENKYPWIWMVEINDIDNEGEFSPLVRSVMDVNLFFFTDNDRDNWLIDDHYTNAIYPMLNEIDFFMKAIADRTDLFGEEVSHVTTNHVNFGDYLIDKGNETQIISDQLSGVQLKMQLPFVVDVCPEDLPIIVCKPARLLTNSVFFTEILAGKTFDLPILDENTLLPVGNPNVGNTAFLVPSAGGAPVNVTLNAILMRTTSIDVVIDIFLFGTINAIGSGTFNGAFFISVRNSGGVTEIGTVVTGFVQVADAVETIKDSAGTNLYVNSILAEGSNIQTITDSVQTITDSAAGNLYTINLLAEGTDTQAISDCVQTIRDSALTILYNINILAQGTDDQTITDSTAVVRRSDLSTIISELILAQASENIDINDSIVALFLSNGTTLLRNVPVMADSTENETLALATVNIFEADGISLLYAKTVDAEQTTSQNIADGINTFNGGAAAGIVAEGTKAFEVVNDAAIPVQVGIIDTNTKTLLKIIVPEAGGGGVTKVPPITGQSAQDRAGDDGARFTAGDYAGGLLTDAWLLTNANPDFPNHFQRFTGNNGGYMDEVTGNFFDKDNVASDKATEFPDSVLRDYFSRRKYGLLRTGVSNWDTGVDFVVGATFGGETGWFPANKEDFNNISHDGGNAVNYIDERLFNFATTNMWTSTSDKKDPTNRAWQVVGTTGQNSTLLKTNTRAFMYAKNF